MGIEIGARYASEGGCEFIVWAPQAHDVAVKLFSPGIAMIPMERDEWGYWRAKAEGITPGARYLYTRVLPNVFFHCTTTYNILRHNGVELGKGDFLGPITD